MKASKELLTFIKAESIMYKNFGESDKKEAEQIRRANGTKEAIEDHLRQAELNLGIYNELENLYAYLSDQKSFEEEKQLLKDAGIWERVPGKGERMRSYWKLAQEEMETE